MNKAFYAVLFFSILVIITASVYLINRNIPLQPFSNQPGFTQIYTPKPGGRLFTTMYTSGENCDPDGIRFNIANEHTLVDRESTWIFTLNNNNATYCTDKPWWSPKIGSHGDDDQASGLYEASVPYNGGFKSMRTEGPHPEYHPVTVINMLTFHQFHMENQLG